MKPTSSDAGPTAIYRKDYRPSDHLIEQVELDFTLGEEKTIVHAKIAFRRQADCADHDLVLHGVELVDKGIWIDGTRLDVTAYRIENETLCIPDCPETFVFESRVEIAPQENRSLQGLYRSSGNFCTQCEACGFRKITWFLDRPDVMAPYRVKITADKRRYPVLLSNGNRIDQGELEDGRHWVLWEDPFKKPSYLFALVAGDLRCHEGAFTTMSKRDIRLEIWVEAQNIDKCEHALRSLQRAMAWDEEVFGLEYDLDLYMIVAVNDFNMGAMENKGLNIFNSKCVLAKPETATDDDYELIEGVIAHEYFHNWTGNRVTCRDWFQLTLKEGLTVFRDEQFTADMTSLAVKRIDDVTYLRTAQFAEDAGPMAHPVRPDSYIEMNNFYTHTVYRKGAEVVRMYHSLLGQAGFRKGMDLYFERHDGQAVTCEDFLAAMADANAVDLSSFARWYEQAGTPVVEAIGSYDADEQVYELTLKQENPLAGENAGPLHMPVAFALLAKSGNELPIRLVADHGSAARRDAARGLLQLTLREQVFRFEGVPEAPVVSLFRAFSAPVNVKIERSRDELAFLWSADTDAFNRWDAGQELAKGVLLELADDWRARKELQLDPAFTQAFKTVLLDASLDGSLKSLALTLPGENFLMQQRQLMDPEAIHAARDFAIIELAKTLRGELEALYAANGASGPYRNDKASIDRRRLANTALRYLTSQQDEASAALVLRQFEMADNMTDSFAALECMAEIETPDRVTVLASFYERWKNDPLVLDMWFRVQAASKLPKALDRILELAEHKDFTLDNPNRIRALIGTFGMANLYTFHSADGRGYKFLADNVSALDSRNPQIASRLVSAFNHWRRFDPSRQTLMKTELERIAGLAKLSKDVGEIVGRALRGGAA